MMKNRNIENKVVKFKNIQFENNIRRKEQREWERKNI